MRPRRWLTLYEVADLLGISQGSRSIRGQFVRRMFRRLEKRDQTTYLHKRGERNSALFVCVEDLSRLDPWNPSTVQALKDEIEKTRARVVRQEKRLNHLEDWAEKAGAYLGQFTSGLRQDAPIKGGGSV